MFKENATFHHFHIKPHKGLPSVNNPTGLNQCQRISHTQIHGCIYTHMYIFVYVHVSRSGEGTDKSLAGKFKRLVAEY